MSFTQTQLDALTEAIAEGTFKVKYQDKEVTYRSLEEMIKLRELMRQELGIDGGAGPRRQIGVYGSGL